MIIKTINAGLSALTKVFLTADRGMDSVYAVADAAALTTENYRDEVAVKARIQQQSLAKEYGLDYEAIRKDLKAEEQKRLEALEAK